MLVVGDIEYEIDGNDFSTLGEFLEVVYRLLFPDYADLFVTPNLDGFNDMLRGGSGTPEEGFTLRWVNHQVSRERLGYPETVRLLESRGEADPWGYLAAARARTGPTVFDQIVEIIRDNAKNGVKLVLL